MQRISLRLRERCIATANRWFSLRKQQLIEEEGAVVCETAIPSESVGGFNASLDMCRAFTTLGSVTISVPRVLFTDAACCFNYEMKQGILDRAAERRDGPQVYDVGLVLCGSALKRAGLTARGNPAIGLVYKPVRACLVRLRLPLCRLRRVLDS